MRLVTASVEHTVKDRRSYILVDKETLVRIGGMGNGKDSDHWHRRVWVVHANMGGIWILITQQILILEPEYLFLCLVFCGVFCLDTGFTFRSDIN